MIPSLGSINFLEWLIEVRETFYLLDHWFIIKGCNSGTARWKNYYVGQDMEKGHGVSMPSPGTSLSPKSGVPTLEALHILFFWIFIEASLPRYDWLNHWPLAIDWTSSPSPLHWGQGVRWVGLKVPTYHKVDSPGNQPPSFGSFQKSPHWHSKRHFHCFHHWGKSKSFRSNVPETGQRPNIYIFHYESHYLTHTHIHTHTQRYTNLCLCLSPTP